MPSFDELARSLLAATDAREAMVAWANQAAPACHAVVHLDHDHEIRGSLRHEAGVWQALPLPPLASPGVAALYGPVDLREQAGDAFTDMLGSLGMRQLLVMPLSPSLAGTLVLARIEPPFAAHEVEATADTGRLLGTALAAHERRAREARREQRESDEIGRLFDLMRHLGRVSDPENAVGGCVHALHDLLRPEGGAMVVSLPGRARPLERSWPDSELGRRALQRARGDDAEGGLGWVEGRTRGSRGENVQIALGWRGRPPARAERVVGAIEGFVGQALARFEDQRLQEEGRLKEIVEGLPLGVALVAAGGRVHLVNENGRELLESVEAWPGEEGVLDRFGSVSLRPLIEQAAAGRPAASEIYLQSQCRTFSVRAVPAPSSRPLHAAETEVLVVIEEVTEAVNQQRQLVQSEKLSALGELISGVVHELNNPLSTVIGYAEMLSQVPESGSRERWIETILQEGQRCQRIVQNMLSLTRSDGDGTRRLVSLGSVAERALSLVSYPYRSAGVSATLSVDADSAAVRGDADALLQVFINLLTNALHALEGVDGEREVRVSVEGAASGNVLIRVADNGPGIPEDLQDRIFEPFFTTKGEGKGTGLGLRLVRTIAEDHGGRVRCESSPGRGAEFLVALPRAERSASVEGSVLGGQQPGVEASARGDLAGARIIVIDDEPAVAEVLCEVLRHSGARVEAQSCSETGLRQVLESEPDVVLCDMHMPNLSGVNLLARLRSERPDLAGRLIFTTGATSGLEDQAAPEHSGRPCLLKPFDFAQVVGRIRAVWRESVALPAGSEAGERPRGEA
jgi:signal transduction histidine kinase